MAARGCIHVDALFAVVGTHSTRECVLFHIKYNFRSGLATDIWRTRVPRTDADDPTIEERGRSDGYVLIPDRSTFEVRARFRSDGSSVFDRN